MQARTPLNQRRRKWRQYPAPDAVLIAHAQHDRRAFEPLYQRTSMPSSAFAFTVSVTGKRRRTRPAMSLPTPLPTSPASVPTLGRTDFAAGSSPLPATSSRTGGGNTPTIHGNRSMRRSRLLDQSATPEEAAIAADDHRVLHSLLAQLKPDQRDLLELRLVGLNDAQIARVLGRSHDAVRKEQSRTISTLRSLARNTPEYGVPHG